MLLITIVSRPCNVGLVPSNSTRSSSQRFPHGGQWWSEANWCREEWDVRLKAENAERVCRIAFDPRSRCWCVQVTYD